MGKKRKPLTVGALLDIVGAFADEGVMGFGRYEVNEDTPVEFSLAPFPDQPFRRFFCTLAGDSQVNGTGSLTIFLDLTKTTRTSLHVGRRKRWLM